MHICLLPRECKKTIILKKTKKTRFFLKKRFLSGFFSNSGFFQNTILCYCKNILKCDIIMFNEVIIKKVYSNDEISKLMHISYCFMGILEKQERESHLSIRQLNGGFPKISQNFSKFPKISQNFSKFLKISQNFWKKPFLLVFIKILLKKTNKNRQ